MSEVAKRVTGVVANTAGNTVGPVVSALMVTAGIATGRPELAAWAIPGGALAGSLTTEGVALVGQAMNDRARRVDQFAKAAEEAAGRPIEDLMVQAADSDPLRALLAQTVEAASGSRDAWKIDTLARAFVKGAKYDDILDEMFVVANLVRDLEVSDVRLLKVFWLAEHHAIGDMTFVNDVMNHDSGFRNAAIPVRYRLVDRQLCHALENSHVLTDLGEYLAVALENLGSMATLPGSKK